MPRRRVPLMHIDSREALASFVAGDLPRRVEFSESFLPRDEAERWRRDINRELAVCGCGHASVTLIFGLVTLTALATQLDAPNLWLRGVGVVLVASAMMSVVKLTIVSGAHRRARQMARNLIDQLTISTDASQRQESLAHTGA